MSSHQFNQDAGSSERPEVQDQVSINIHSKLSRLLPNPPEHAIFRVRHQLREVNEKAYEPEILAIGPYHHGNDKFKFMEEQKLRYMQRSLERNEWTVDTIMPTLEKLEEPARSCYAEIIDLTREEFLEMMLIDGCFIVEFIRECVREKREGRDDPISWSDGIQGGIRHDLLLLENQLPLLVLSKLYDVIKGENDPLDLSDVIVQYFQNFKFEERDRIRNWKSGEGGHLLHLYHIWWTSGKPKNPLKSITLRPSATELRKSGVRFQAAQGSDPTSIKFKDGILEIPFLKVVDHTEKKLRNLIAFEQHYQMKDITHFTDYANFMDSLINSSKDIEVLRHAGIIENYVGGDEVVARMFNKMGDYVSVSNFGYSETCESLNEYCSRKWNIWMAKLRRQYFSSPWAFLSVLAAIVLLLLTAAQTVFAVLSYTK